jgi:2,3-bisphosphoglycerate-independent phosphoglycerate mutase
MTTVKDNDSVIFFNLRSDRARQLTKAFVQDDFVGFRRKIHPKNLLFVAMTDFGPDLGGVITAYPSHDIVNTLPMVLDGNFHQLYIAESEKYAHVTYFFNGGYADPVSGESRVVIPSVEAEHYDKFPEMRAKEITDYIIRELEEKKYNFVTVNYANADMVGHTGNLKATIQAVACIDVQLGRLYDEVVKKLGGILIITGDHGNADEVINIKKNEIDTQHSFAPVPLIIISDFLARKHLPTKGGILGDIAPTILDILGVKKPKEMRNSLFKK